ncbi:type II secretion system F family protein [Calidifontibacillus erzurumensis]|uniref:Type II secretion system F family protein n=1 Tax=Calidifontibacillus erzurumensis TaxID=2741433 RepID=A0A8J8GFZ0_9BACI|nr:type II secretion system F family protein [Calidifontibacillus erzurumensis]NSL51605.1 type II secretion system F family protein [Calidifontibacillus erzurumensis]
MAQYKYTARLISGKKQTGIIRADTRREAIAKLKDRGVRVLQIEDVPETAFNKDIYIGRPVKLIDFVIFLRQFATLLRAGVTIVDSTRILAMQTESKALRKALYSVLEDLNQGIPLSECTAKHKQIFPPIFVNLVKAGEASGALDDTLERLSDYFEKQHETKKKIQSALAYPIIVGIIAVGVVIFLLNNVVPTFADMFADFGGELPAITQFVLGASDWVQANWWVILLSAIIFMILLLAFRKLPSTKYYIDYAALKMPLFGKVIQKALLARMASTLSSLFSSSVPILEAVSIVEKVVENEVFVKVLRDSRKSLEQGISLTVPMKGHWVFPPLVVQMLAIGEKTGTLDAMLSKVANFYELEVKTATDQIKSLIEPIMIVILAVVVGTIVLAIMVPMFEIYSQVQ